MRVLVTAGGTVERIDDVRGITNFSTGRLGCLIAENYSQQAGVEVTYICGKHARRPTNHRIKIIEIEDVTELLKTIKKCLEREAYEIVVHSMAVSDYYLVGTTSEETLIQQFQETKTQSVDKAEQLRHVLNQAFLPINQQTKKMSSTIETVYFKLEQTPKVISLIKKLQPAVTLVGFKLLVDVSEEELFQVATKLMTANDCDYVLANDKQTILGDQHVGYLIDKSGEYVRYLNKQAIAHGIVEQTMRGRHK